MNENLDSTQQVKPISQEGGLFEKMNKILYALKEDENSDGFSKAFISRGEKAEIRRAALEYLHMDNGTLGLGPLIKLFFRFDLPLPQLQTNNNEQLSISEKWALWIYCAIKAQKLHQDNESLGKSLAEAEYSQMRLLRLLNSNGRSFVKEIISAIHFLRSKGQDLDLKNLSYLIFSTGIKEAEKARFSVSKDFFSNLESKLKRTNL